MQAAPIWILFMVGMADQRIDAKEEEAFNSYMQNVLLLPEGFTRELLMSALDESERVRSAFDSDISRTMPDTALERVATILERNVPAEDALIFKAFLIALGEEIAIASGRWFRPKKGKEERTALALIRIWLDIDPFEIEETINNLYQSKEHPLSSDGDTAPPIASETAQEVRNEEPSDMGVEDPQPETDQRGSSITDGGAPSSHGAEGTLDSQAQGTSGTEHQNRRTARRPRLRRTHKWASGAHMPIDEDGTSESARTDPLSLYGEEIVNHVYSEMSIDDEWSVRDNTGYTWWGGQLRQQVRGTPITQNGVEFITVAASTDLLQGIDNSWTALAAANTMNMSAGMGSIIVDPQAARVKMITSVIAHPGVMDYRERLNVATAYQVAEAHRLIEMLAASMGGSPAASMHPTNGPRTYPDEMLNVIEHIPLSDGLVPLHKGDFEETLAAVPVPRDFPVVVEGNASDHGLVVEFPFYHATPAMYLDTTDADAYIGTALLTLSVRDSDADVYWNSMVGRIGTPPMTPRHTGAFSRYGSGLHVRLGLPAAVSERDGIRLAAELNQMEADGLSMNSLVGSWYAESDGLWFTAYFPNLLIAPHSHDQRIGILTDLVVSNSSRTQWARTVLDGRIPHPGDRRRKRGRRWR